MFIHPRRRHEFHEMARNSFAIFRKQYARNRVGDMEPVVFSDDTTAETRDFFEEFLELLAMDARRPFCYISFMNFTNCLSLAPLLLVAVAVQGGNWPAWH